MEKIYEVEILDNNNYGNGISRINNMVVFIPKTIKGEIIKIELVKQEKKYSFAKIVEIIKPSSDRTKPLCEHYNECGGCNFQHLKYKKELEIKENYIKKLFPNTIINEIVDTKEYNYRNKVTFHVKNQEIGFYKKNSNTLIPINKCLLLDESIIKAYEILKKISLKNIKEIMIRSNLKKEIMIKVTGEIENNDIINILKIENLKSLYQNDKLIYQEPYLTEEINNSKYTIYPNAFFQVNPIGMIKIYDEIKQLVGKGETLLDLYCGTGTIGIYVKDSYKNITGIEINKESIKNAKINKKLNKINNIDFICNDAGTIKNKYETIVVDPPRNGLSKKVINKILEIKPQKIIYTSCNPNTLKRDTELLKEQYEIQKITPFNMFPKTEHIECVSVLHRKGVEK